MPLAPDLVDMLLAPPATPHECPDVEAWWPRHLGTVQRWSSPIERAIAGGALADRTGWAFASGYQAALRALLPSLPDDTIAAMCVTEEAGNRPKAIRSTIGDAAAGGRLRLDGSKRWTTLGPASGLLLVAAVDARGPTTDRPRIRVATVPTGAAGVSLEPMPETRFVPEVPHARVRFEGVDLPAQALLPGDGYDLYVKPFRSIEDTLVSAAVLAYLLVESRRRGWAHDWSERALATLLAFSELAGMDARAAPTHLLLAGTLAWAHALFDEASSLFARGPRDASARRWERDATLTQVAGTARTQRAARAWERYDVKIADAG
jgi:acyl-CoA dehydrogenase